MFNTVLAELLSILSSMETLPSGAFPYGTQEIMAVPVFLCAASTSGEGKRERKREREEAAFLSAGSSD